MYITTKKNLQVENTTNIFINNQYINITKTLILNETTKIRLEIQKKK
jgi:hypothetical protein